MLLDMFAAVICDENSACSIMLVPVAVASHVKRREIC